MSHVEPIPKCLPSNVAIKISAQLPAITKKKQKQKNTPPKKKPKPPTKKTTQQVKAQLFPH